MISVIDMPPPEESSWWRGKKGFEVGFFPSECVEVIGDKVPHSFKLSNTSTKPVFRRHGKLIAFFRSFLLSRPSRRKLKQSGILKERVFGCDLGEHLLNTGREIPMVLKCCAEFIEEHGIVDGIYRLSGVSSNIQRLRLAFDEDRPINLGDPATVHDIHSVASLLKMYFRELPNPLLTYQLYDKFVSAVQSSEDVRLLRVRDVVQQLPPPHFRTLQYLLNHLARIASHGEDTGMTPKNIAIVWAPNLLRSRDVENGGVGALHVVGVQAVLTEYLIRFADLIFDEKIPLLPSDQEGLMLRTRPKSLAISTPTKLLTLEEARARALSTHLPLTQQKYIEVGGGPDKLPSKYHTVIELPSGKHGLPKLKKSPSGWKSFFSRGWYSGSARDKSRTAFRTSRKASTGSLPHPSGYMQEKSSDSEPDAPFTHRKKLRTVKSAESLVHCVKESPQSTNQDDMSGGSSHKSSPQVSVDSSNSLEVSLPSSKSPGLQKHTRSSSHESYFENNGMDIISDPSFEEDEHGLLYYVSEQMRMLQDSEAWDTGESKYRKDLECSKSAETNNLCEMESEKSCDSEKNVRKQKLSAGDDFAQAKFQKLSEMDFECASSPSSAIFKTFDSASDDACCHMDCSHRTLILDKSQTVDNFHEADDESCQDRLSPADDVLTLDPITLYDAILNKRTSPVSLPDAENDPSSRTVVERYGNAETVLVEVHATQDSSEEEEHSLTDSCNTNENKEESFESLPDAIQTDNTYNTECNESKLQIAELPSSSTESVKSSGSPDIFPSVFNIHSDPVTEQSNVSYSSSLPKADDADVSENVLSSAAAVTSDIKLSEKILCDQQSRNLPCAIETSSKIDLMDEDVLKDVKVREKQHDSNLEDPSSRKKVLNLKLDSCTKKGYTFDRSEELDGYHSFSINTPPSPVYPPKSLKSHEFQSLRTKMETIPLHKKKQILNIPSPSSPVEEVRKKFELHASNPRKTDIKTRSNVRDLASKHQKAFEMTEPEECEKRKSETVRTVKCDTVLNKRHSEPPPKTVESNLSDTNKRMSSKFEETSIKAPVNVEKQSNKSKVSQPSLFTQLKIRKLQSLQAEANVPPPAPVDPWSDPILDMQEEYHPIISYLPTSTFNSEMNELQENEQSKSDSDEVIQDHDDFEIDNNIISDDTDRNDRSELSKEKEGDISVAKTEQDTSSFIQSECLESDISNEFENQQLCCKLNEAGVESEAVKRERINRIKEERRAQLREKLKQESFRLEAEEKEKVQTKFRLRKDCLRYSASVENQEKTHKTVKKSDKAVETDTADITETGTNCNLNTSADTSKNSACLVDSKNELDKSTERNSELDSSALSARQQKTSPKRISSDDYILLHNKSNAEKKSGRSYEDTRKWLSMPPTDIRDKVAMFERSKDTKELCRLGPNGKFPQKQSTSTLASSFVR
ncbi:GTPase-activating protein CdGAPr-like isoform X2 [Stegodyphus dumicola]|nr:GTPase-activating protein CdGAPr-like isoform X2 [Stegodyphus dumicola]